MAITDYITNATYYGAGHGLQSWTGEPNPEFYVQQIAQMIYKLIRVQGSQLLSVVRSEPAHGEMHGTRRLHPGTTTMVTKRHRTQVPEGLYDILVGLDATAANYLEAYQEPVADMRWMVPQIAKYEPLIGTDWDPLFAEVTPENEWVEDGTEALGRRYDRIIFDAIFGTAFSGHNTGESGALTPVAWSTGNGGNIIIGGGVGLTKDKILQVAEEMDNMKVPANDRIALITAKQKTDILNNNEFVSGDYRRDPRPLEDNAIGGLMGFEWRVIANDSGVASETDIIPKDASERRCAFYHRKAIKAGIWDRFRAKTKVLEQQDDDKAIKITSTIGASRLEEKLVWEVRCAELT